MKLIRTKWDVTRAHVEAAADMRDGLYGEERLPWPDVLDRLEQGSGEDWGNGLDSPAIRELQNRVARMLKGE